MHPSPSGPYDTAVHDLHCLTHSSFHGKSSLLVVFSIDFIWYPLYTLNNFCWLPNTRSIRLNKSIKINSWRLLTIIDFVIFWPIFSLVSKIFGQFYSVFGLISQSFHNFHLYCCKNFRTSMSLQFEINREWKLVNAFDNLHLEFND